MKWRPPDYSMAIAKLPTFHDNGNHLPQQSPSPSPSSPHTFPPSTSPPPPVAPSPSHPYLLMPLLVVSRQILARSHRGNAVGARAPPALSRVVLRVVWDGGCGGRAVMRGMPIVEGVEDAISTRGSDLDGWMDCVGGLCDD